MKTFLKYIICFILVIFPLRVCASACTSVIDSKSGRVLYSSNQNNKYLIASTTNIMTI